MDFEHDDDFLVEFILDEDEQHGLESGRIDPEWDYAL